MEAKLLLLFGLLVSSGFFSASEIAFASLNKVKVRRLLEEKAKGAKSLARLKENPQRFLISILIGNNLVNITAASLTTVLTIEVFGSAAVGIATGILTLLVLIFGEIIPKSYATAHAERFALATARPIEWLGSLLSPVIFLLELLTKFSMKILGTQEGPLVTEKELRIMAKVAEEEGTIESEEREMIESLFKFNDITAEDVMTPRVEMFCLEANQRIADVLREIRLSSFSRIPIYEKTIDRIVGVIYARDILRHITEKKALNTRLKNLAREAFFVPQSKNVAELLREFQEKNVHIAIVLDEYGGTEGLVTLEDLLEELVGEIIDETDVNPELMMRVDKNTILVDGKTELRAIRRFFNVQFPGDELDTVSSLALEKIGRIPRTGEQFSIGRLSFIIQEVDRRKIRRVKIMKTPA